MTKIIGGAMMVAGTSIGASMIGMPLQTAQVGWGWSILILIVVSAVMLYAANMVSAIYINLKTDSTISKIAGNVLGKGWQFICSGATLMLMYALLIAYLSGASEMISDSLSIGYTTTIVSMTLVLLGSLAISNAVFDYYNRAAFSLKIVFMIVMTVLLMPHVSCDEISSSSTVQISSLNMLTVLPLFVTSFGFHAGIPFIFKHLNGDVQAYKKAVLYGVASTLMIYVIWLTMCLGTTSSVAQSSHTLSSFVSRLTSITNSAVLNAAIRFFMILAILTSLFGVATTLFDFISEFIDDRFRSHNRLLVSAIVFLIPLGFAMTDKSLFIKSLGVAGISLTIIAIFVPSMICLKLRIYNPNNIAVAICMGVGLLTVIGELIAL